MKPILVKSLTYNFSGHSVGVWIYVPWFFFFERLVSGSRVGAKWPWLQQWRPPVAFAGALCSPHFTPQNPLTGIDSCGKTKVYRTPAQCLSQIFILYLYMSSSNFAWLLSRIQPRPRCIDCKQQGVVAWGGILTGGVARNNTKQHIARGNIWTHSGCCFHN